MKKYTYYMVFFISMKSFSQQAPLAKIPVDTSWKDVLGYIAAVSASAGMGALCGYYDAVHVGPALDKVTRHLNSISRSKKEFEDKFPHFYYNQTGDLHFKGGTSLLMWFSAWYTRVSLIRGIREESSRSWVKRSLGMASFLATWSAYALCYGILRKDPVSLNIDNFKNWE